VDSWPNPWRYQKLIGDWQIDGEHHRLDFQLDNLHVRATGNYGIETDRLDLLAHLTIGNDPDLASFDANELLIGVPIPTRCTGKLAELTCEPDERASRKALAGALAGDTELRRKLDEKIDEEVPEEYRDAARALLDLLGQ
jgi:hypothetical protein|tara:strand:+ start:146 stop:565 length:420 start_codon:yes stop_codon:yes gene_type:complete